MTALVLAERGDRDWLSGRRAEAAAEALLASLGYGVRARRFRARGGEIDLVMDDGDVLVFVEVKGRAGHGFGSPGERVDARKQLRIARAAAAFLALSHLGDRVCRFDVVEVETGPDGDRVRHIEDAFRLVGRGRPRWGG